MTTEATVGDEYIISNEGGGFAYRLYDPRDPEQKLEDEATWKPTRNSALFLAHFIVALARKKGVPLNDDYWKQMCQCADHCDEVIAAPNGAP